MTSSREPLLILSRVLDAMIAHCQREAPLEACGFLAGSDSRRATTIHPLRNALASATRYNADPRELIAAVVAMRAAGEQMVAIYHSHPVCEAIPSGVDLRNNGYGPLPQVIVSLAEAEPRVRVWTLGETEFAELEWVKSVETENGAR